jgi:internalin A
MSELAKKLIEENLQTKETTLDLGNCGLDGTEPALERLGECTHLETLILSDEWWDHSKRKFYKSSNQETRNDLKQLPQNLPSGLQTLIAGSKSHQSKLDGIEAVTQCGNLQQLYLRNLCIRDIQAIGELTQLWLIDIRNNNIIDLAPLVGLPQLKYVDLKWNHVKDLAPLATLEQVEELYLRNNNISELAPLGNLSQLKNLDLRYNNIEHIEALQGLTQMQKLSLSNNQIVDISPLQNLKALNGIYLTSNKVADISPLAHLTKLKWVYLSTNQISDLTPLAGLTAISDLYIRQNQITDLTPLQGLIKMKELHASYNQIGDISPLRHLKNMRWLFLRKIHMHDLSPLEALTDLVELNVNENHISNIESLRKLKKLKKLEIKLNKIRHLSLDLLEDLPQLKSLFITDNPLENVPVEIRQKGLKAIRSYLDSVDNQADRRPLYEAKLIFVGVGEVGKTELAEAISQHNYEFASGRATTKGIRIKQWLPPNCEVDDEEISFTANIWDFAGQEINYGTHQFFLTKNSVYVFVWETRKGEQTEAFNYWLRIVSLLSDKAPIIVVQNKIDIYESEIDQKNWKKRFPNIVGFLKTSCKTGQGIDILRDTVIDELLELPHIREIWNKNRFAVRQTLEQHEADYIAKREYLQICKKHEVNRTDAGYLSSQLHDIGTILHFGNEAKLKNTIVLKPQWATEAAYLLRDSHRVVQGRFTLHDLDDIWHEDRFVDMHMFLLGLMEEFELIFQLQDDIKYIIPELLPSDTPPSAIHIHPAAHEARHLRFEYHYDFMPKGIMSRFICRMHELIHDELFWKYGVVLAYEQSQAKVLWDDTGVQKIISIEAWGAEADKLLFLIRNHFDHIHAKLNHPPLTEKVPCVCPAGCDYTSDPQLHDYATLLKFQTKGKATRVCDKSVEDVSIQAMLEGIADNEQSDTQNLLELINDNNVAGFFDTLNDMEVEDQQLSALRDEFVHGTTSFQFADQLKVWVQGYFKKRVW